MKPNIMTKLIWLAACAAVLLPAENAVHAEKSAPHQTNAQQGRAVGIGR